MDEKAQAVRRVREDEGRDEGMGRPAGSTQEGGEGYHAVTDAVVHVRDKVAVMGTIMGIRRGRSTAVWAGRQFREVRFKHNRQDLIIIKMFDVVKSLADVQVKSYHNGESYIGPWLFMAQSLREGVQAGIIPSLSCHQSSKSSQASQPEAAFLLCRFKLEIARDTEIMCLKGDAGWGGGNNLLFYTEGMGTGTGGNGQWQRGRKNPGGIYTGAGADGTSILKKFGQGQPVAIPLPTRLPGKIL